MNYEILFHSKVISYVYLSLYSSMQGVVTKNETGSSRNKLGFNLLTDVTYRSKIWDHAHTLLFLSTLPFILKSNVQKLF